MAYTKMLWKTDESNFRVKIDTKITTPIRKQFDVDIDARIRLPERKQFNTVFNICVKNAT